MLIEFSPAHAEETLRVDQLSNDLFKLTLTSRNKCSIFSEAIERLDHGRDEADLILRNLQAWSPDVAEHFSRRTSDIILNTPFRLICSSSAGIPLDGAFAIRQYLAVSYSWHNPDWPGTPSSDPEPGGIWPIGKRFATAILAQRGHPREGVWIDQVCINQSDEDEKQRAIACMDVIYKSCRKLVVLLEDVELTENEVLLCERYDQKHASQAFSHVVQDTEEIACLISMFSKIAAARWWQRAWCFHEFVVAEPWSDKRHLRMHNTVFIMGGGGDRTFALEWITLHVILSIVVIQLGHQTPQSEHLYPILSGFENRTSPLLDSCDRKAGAMTASFMARFNAVAQTGCSMPGDRLSVCLNLIGLGLAYYKAKEPTPDEVYYLAAMVSLAAGEKMPLTFANTESLVIDKKKSWLTRSIAAADTTLPKFSLGGIRGIHNISVGRLEIDLIFFESPFVVCTEEELRETYAIFPNVIKSTPPPLKASMGHQPQFTADEDMDLHRRRFLAAIVGGGHGLARRLWTQLEREVVQSNYNLGKFADFASNNDLRPSAVEFLKALSKDGPKGPDERHYITQETALALLTWITDPRSIYWISAFSVRIPCTQDGEQALVTGFHMTKDFLANGNETQIRVAVPTDLLRGDCAWTRAWLLVLTEDTQRGAVWKIAGKALLLGESDLMGSSSRTDGGLADAVVTLRKRQVVVG
ncbi:O-methyltransferase family 2 [Colletotrichum tofieldiae]|uniref:O-methyltransferase family 2 n=1 Tax=Colletotrichum tofieldiae TaxID=708197 RepID=A0A166P884_9PEZI|nr:O-methyltransferase family 2 [Colletotrichum tofieldiae]GKT66367.1 O-methyltransferase family 2 [Colletotrichum tofieldiae]GKT82077.1 O-methyltransferase family 2 [Colletotrichum tofieldiae]